jgi:hypothetical protein
MPSSGVIHRHLLGHLLPRRAAGRTRWRNRGDLWIGCRAKNASSDHRRADEVSDAGGLDGHGGNGVICANLQELRAATVRYPVLEVTATVEPFENGRGFALRVWRASKPRGNNQMNPPDYETSREISDTDCHGFQFHQRCSPTYGTQKSSAVPLKVAEKIR